MVFPLSTALDPLLAHSTSSRVLSIHTIHTSYVVCGVWAGGGLVG
jgi:hypothetical protein